MKIPFIVEVWCSPSRQEFYHINIVPVFAGEPLGTDDDLKQYFLYFGDFFYDAFGEDYLDAKGLWKVVCNVNLHYETHYTYDGPDDCVEFEYEEIFRGQCSSWEEVRFVWSGLKKPTT